MPLWLLIWNPAASCGADNLLKATVTTSPAAPRTSRTVPEIRSSIKISEIPECCDPLAAARVFSLPAIKVESYTGSTPTSRENLCGNRRLLPAASMVELCGAVRVTNRTLHTSVSRISSLENQRPAAVSSPYEWQPVRRFG